MIPAHGKLDRYKRHGCRCDLCREANNVYVRRYRGSQKQAPAWASAKLDYVISPMWCPDTLTRAELLEARGYPK